nr:MAG TPA: hypothetical protein [Caudoviricetes sp.]DAU24329.1 MAG TPA: hypothetical protein [Bacteriophage sp.]
MRLYSSGLKRPKTPPPRRTLQRFPGMRPRIRHMKAGCMKWR